jgi:nucleoside-diphosphate-sugar epimerase
MVPAGATFVEGDVADSKRLEAILADGSVAGVMHFAALIEAGESMRHPETYFRNNTAATLALLETMVKNNLRRLVFSSTAAVYGEPVSTPIVEEAALAPTNARHFREIGHQRRRNVGAGNAFGIAERAERARDRGWITPRQAADPFGLIARQ